jgi:hypothetical protein
VSETRIVHDLGPLTFDGLDPVAVIDIDTNFGTRLAEKVFPYIDASADEGTGRLPLRCTVTLFFSNVWKSGAFPGLFGTWFKRLQDGGKPGKLSHPLLGEFDAVVPDGSFRIAGTDNAGIRVQVSFKESIPDPETPTELTFESGSASDIAAVVDQCMAAMGLSYPSGMGADTLVALVDKVTSLPADIVGEVGAKLDSLVGTIDRIHQAVAIAVENANALEDALRDEVQNSVERITLERMIWDFRFTVKAMKEKAEKTARATKSVITDAPTTLPSLSYQLGADLSGMIQLNPTLLKSPSVPKGTKVLYFA